MKLAAELVCLMPLVLSLCLVVGCESVPGGPEAAGGPSISRVSFHGWQDAYRISNGEYEVVVVPQIARIMAYGPVGGDSILWVNDALTPERAAAPLNPEEWQNYGGYKLWPAPQKDWGWPPDPPLDRGPCRAEVTGPGSLRLMGTPSAKHGIRFEREITLAPTGSRLDIVQTAVNVSDKSVATSIWDVTQVKADCVGFVPLGPGATYRTGEGGAPDEQWTKADGMLLVKPAGKNGKVFISGPPGWLGCKRGGFIYVKAFDIAPTAPPEPETPREVYTGDMGYIELEIVGPAVTLEPGATTTLNETWHLLPARGQVRSDEGLVKTLWEKARQPKMK